MIKSGNLLDTSGELRIFCFGNGIKLMRPEEAANKKISPWHYDTGHTLSSILKLPLCVTFLNIEANTQTINELSAATSGFLSVKDAIGKSIRDATKAECGKIIMSHNREVMRLNKKLIFEESILRKDNTSKEIIAIKSPWYNDKNKVVGLFGCGFRLDKSTIADSLSLASQLGILNSREPSSNGKINILAYQINDVCFTKRQTEILFHLVRGKSAKYIGELLQLSPRTIESYIISIKLKVGVNSKSELIDRVFDHFYPKIK